MVRCERRRHGMPPVLFVHCRRGPLLLVFLIPAIATRVFGDFSEPMRVTDGTGLSTQTATGIDIANNAYISSVKSEKISVRIVGPGLDVEAPIQAAGAGQGDPDFATTSSGITYMSFSQLDAETPGGGREVFLTHNPGGGFRTPVNISQNRVDDYAPRLLLDSGGQPHLVWAQRIQEEARVMYWRMGYDAPITVAQGDYPALFVDGAGVVHVAYSRSNDIYYMSNSGSAFRNERRVTTTAVDPEASTSIGGDATGRIYVSYESRSTLYIAEKPALGNFLPPRPLDAGGVQDPRMRVRQNGEIAIVYVKNGDVRYILGIANLSQPIGEPTAEVESRPSIEIDLSNNLHVSFLRNGDAYYTNNASAPTAEFSAQPTQGEVPLAVRFGDLSSGNIQVWEWDFGDGGHSTLPNPTHTYNEPGKYSVTLRVVAAGATESVVMKEDFVTAQDPSNEMRIPNQRVFPGQQDVWFPVLADHVEPIQAFQVMGTFDPNNLVLQSFELEHSAVHALQPEWKQFNDKETYFEVGVIFEFPGADATVDDVFLPPGQNQTLLNLVFDVSEDALEGATTQITLLNNTALSPVINIFTVDGFSRFPVLRSSSVEIIVLVPPYLRPFRRGDVDANDTVDITDAVNILNFLFAGGAQPPCMDAADVQDTGKVDISAAVSLLGYLFLGGAQPAVPFPVRGLDPSPDALGDCEH